MKVHHFALIFIIFFLAATVKTDFSIGKLKAVRNEKTKLSESLDTATSDAVSCLAKSGTYGTDSINKDKIVTSFLTSLYSSLDIISDKNAQVEIELYIPVILLCDTDGYYVYYYDEYKGTDGLTYSMRTWSEKMPYFYQDDCFTYRFTLTDTVYIYDPSHLLSTENMLVTDYHEIQTGSAYETFRTQHSNSILLNDESLELARKGSIVGKLEEVLSYYTSKHNAIAKHNGITYNFSFPAGNTGEWATYMDDVNLTVVFQGYPYGGDRNYTFNKIASCGANIIKKQLHYVEKKGWYYLAHKAGCPKLAESTTILDETFDSLQECAKIGAYCDDCIEGGVKAPEIK